MGIANNTNIPNKISTTQTQFESKLRPYYIIMAFGGKVRYAYIAMFNVCIAVGRYDQGTKFGRTDGLYRRMDTSKPIVPKPVYILFSTH